MKALCLLGAVLALAGGVFAAEAPVETLAIGAGAPDFTLPGVDGRNWSLDDFKDSPVLVVVFTCNHCPTAQAYEGRLKRLVEDYRERGVAVVAISPNDPQSVRLDELGYTDLSDSLPEMKLRAAAQKFNFPYLFAGDKEAVCRAYGPTATPHAFVFDGERKLRYAGRIDDAEREEKVSTHDLRNALDALLAGKRPEVAQTRVFGCSIKWPGKQEQVKAWLTKADQEPVSVEPLDVAGLQALRKGSGSGVRLVNFWATWCGPCVAEFPDLVEVNRMYRNRDFEMVTISANDPAEKAEVLRFLTKQHASMKNFHWNGASKDALAENFDPKWQGELPLTVLLGPAGEILYKHSGAVESLELKRAIVEALGRGRKK